MVKQPKCTNLPPPAIQNYQSPKGLLSLQLFESDVSFEEYKCVFFGDKCPFVNQVFPIFMFCLVIYTTEEN